MTQFGWCGAMLLSTHIVATLYMFGLIWFVQLVHYPLFGRVGTKTFADYEAAHKTRTSRAAVPPMLVELSTACALLVWRPARVNAIEAIIGLAIIVAIWVSTFLLQVPAHTKLAGGFDRKAATRLVSTNWIRTIGWSARAGLCAVWIARLG